MSSSTKKMTVSAIMVALATVLSLIKVLKLPLGGSVTLFSMVPIVLVGAMYGAGWGFSAAAVYSAVQLALGAAVDGLFAWGLDAPSLIGCILLDYVVAYTALGVSGLFYKKRYAGMLAGVALALVMRFAAHFLSGVIIFANFEEFVIFGKAWVGRPYLYSLCYNGSYMLPELIFTVAAVAILFKTPAIRRLLSDEK